MECSSLSLSLCSVLVALFVDEIRTRLVVFFFGNEPFSGGGEGGKDRPADQHRVLTLGRSDDLDLGIGRGKCSHLHLHTLSEPWVHGGATRENDVAIEVLADIGVIFHDGKSINNRTGFFEKATKQQMVKWNQT